MSEGEEGGRGRREGLGFVGRTRVFRAGHRCIDVGLTLEVCKRAQENSGELEKRSEIDEEQDGGGWPDDRAGGSQARRSCPNVNYNVIAQEAQQVSKRRTRGAGRMGRRLRSASSKDGTALEWQSSATTSI